MDTRDRPAELRAPLEGIVVVDLSRMLPGAILARQLLDLGARLIKVEDPGTGDPFRHLPPLVGDMSAGFAALLRGAESIELDLTAPADRAILLRLIRIADVTLESFRPGTIQRWGLGRDRLRDLYPGLIQVSLPAYGSGPEVADRIGHDLNLVAETGLLSCLGTGGVPRVQLADVATGLLAATAVVAALLQRQQDGRGRIIEQPLVSGALPFLTWTWADATAAAVQSDEHDSILQTLLAGRVPAYRTYRCACGTDIAVAALEPKLWIGLVELLGLERHAGAGLDSGDDGAAAAADLAAALAARPRDHWLDLAREHALPLSAVTQPADEASTGLLELTGLMETTPASEISGWRLPGPFLPGLGRTPSRPAPGLGEHTARILDELGGR